ncbi:hypothetical protein GCM10010174_82420 [Kutzneria viridogrisea]|uniref:DNA-binding SARP family transcriptional activator/DNA-binding CsgD family transcriptional regulator n=1 Tax=Kutzneria viridogrisea TaxID=47990 RepID=A0ABR6BEJ6_9PSEU|nr:DNA-binding SARP family transcriptional activator/DNA-binding CsgD family transcriptional regulator [Kutzneria viridogrisea]
MALTTIKDKPRALAPRDHEVLRALGRGLTNTEIAAALAMPTTTVARHVGRILSTLGLRDRAAAIVYAFDHGIVTPGRPLKAAVREPAPRLRISVLGPLRAWRGRQPLDLGPVRQQALFAALVLRPDVTVSQRELLDGVWGPEPPAGNVVPVYVYRLRKCLHPGGHRPDPVISRDKWGYRLPSGGMSVDSARMEEIAAEAGAAERAGDLVEAVSGCTRALGLFQGEPLAGLSGPFAEVERLRLTERRMALAQQKAQGQLRLGRHSQAIDELLSLTSEHPHCEPVAALLMRALHGSGRRADALAVFTRTRRRLIDDLDVEPGETLLRAQRAVLRR